MCLPTPSLAATIKILKALKGWRDAWQLRALVALREDLSLVPGTHTAAYNSLKLVPRNLTFSSEHWALVTHAVLSHMQTKHPHT